MNIEQLELHAPELLGGTADARRRTVEVSPAGHISMGSAAPAVGTSRMAKIASCR
jgi:hypothetical protein